MTWYPMGFLPPQYDDSTGKPYSGAVLKAYRAETNTVIPMATDSSGETTAESFRLNSAGYPTSGGMVIIPHIQEDYKIALYPSQQAADNDSGAVWTYDDVRISDVQNEPFYDEFSGDGTTQDFVLSDSMGTDERALLVFADRVVTPNTIWRGVLRPDEFTVDGVNLHINFAVPSGTKNILVYSPSYLFGALGDLVANAATSEANALQYRNEAESFKDQANNAKDDAELAKTGAENAVADALAIYGSMTDIQEAVDEAEDARDEAVTAKGESETARDFAHEWATQAEDVPVNDGVNPPGFSARHWAAKAAQLISSGMASLISFLPYGNLISTNVQGAIQELHDGKVKGVVKTSVVTKLTGSGSSVTWSGADIPNNCFKVVLSFFDNRRTGSGANFCVLSINGATTGYASMVSNSSSGANHYETTSTILHDSSGFVQGAVDINKTPFGYTLKAILNNSVNASFLGSSKLINPNPLTSISVFANSGWTFSNGRIEATFYYYD